MPAVTLHTYFIKQNNEFLSDKRRRAARMPGGHVAVWTGDWPDVLSRYYHETTADADGNKVLSLRRLPECLDKVAQVGRQPTIEDRKKSLPLFFLGELHGGKEGTRRTKINTRALWAIGVDLDGKTGRAPHFAEVLEFTMALGHRAEVHTTAKHQPDAPRVRVLFLFDEPLPNQYGLAVWEYLVSQYDLQGWERDPSTKDASRGWYAPTGAAENYEQGSVEGEHLNWRPLVKDADDDAAIRSGKQDKNTTRARIKSDATIYLEDGTEISPGELLESMVVGDKQKCFCPALDSSEHSSVSAFAAVHMYAGRPTLYVHCGAVHHMAHEDNRLVARYSDGGTVPVGAMPGATPVSNDLVDMLVKSMNKKTGAITIRKSTANLAAILEYDEEFAGKLRFDTFTGRGQYDGEMIRNVTPTHIQRYLSSVYGVDWPYESIAKGVSLAADGHQFDQRVEWLETLPPWKDSLNEAKVLLGDLAHTGFGVKEFTLYRTYMMRFMVGLIARAMDPGCKHDTMPILTGVQGVKKSMVFEALMHDLSWFSDTNIPINDTKTAVERMTGVWLLEWAELNAMSSVSFGEVKQFTASRKDQLRLAYGRFTEIILRRGCRIGSSNPDAVLHDLTGSRREWPMRSTGTNPEWVIDNRDRLFAAALALYSAGEQWWLTDDEDLARIDDAENFRIASELVGFIALYVDRRRATTMARLDSAIQMNVTRRPRGVRAKAALILSNLGWDCKRVRLWDGKQTRVWCAPDIDSADVKALGEHWHKPFD